MASRLFFLLLWLSIRHVVLATDNVAIVADDCECAPTTVRGAGGIQQQRQEQHTRTGPMTAALTTRSAVAAGPVATIATKGATRKLRPDSGDVRLPRSMFLPPRTNLTLSEKLASIKVASPALRGDGDCDHHDFAERLRLEEDLGNKEINTISGKKENIDSSSNVACALLGAAASLLLTTTILSPTTLWTEYSSVVNSIVAVHWIRQLFRFGDVIVLSAHVLLISPETRAAFRKHVWPTVVSTIRTILLAEAWSYFWKLAWKVLPTSSTRTGDEDEEKSSSNMGWPSWIPEWMQAYCRQTNSYVDGLVLRGTRRIIQKVLQKNVQFALGTIVSHGTNLWESYSTTTGAVAATTAK